VSNLALGTEIAGHRIESEIGRGGMGVVYLAQHLRLGRKVALKVLSPELAADEGFRRRFVRESQTAANLEHPNIITVYDAGEAGGVLYISMRYVPGTDLHSLLRGEGPLAPDLALWILDRVAAALDAAHAEALVHRDVKPGNILLRRSSSAGPIEGVYLSDFGITKNLRGGSVHTESGQFVGTIDYMAPEQFRGTAPDGRTDVYSLGCVLYECLSGEVPYRRDSVIEVMYAHLQDSPPPIASLQPGLPSVLDDVLRRALAKRPDERFASCGALMEASSEALRLQRLHPETSGLTPPAIPPRSGEARPTPGAVERPRARPHAPRRTRRRRVVATMLLLVLLGAVVSAGVLLSARGGRPRSLPSNSPTFGPEAFRIDWSPHYGFPLSFRGSGNQVINRATVNFNTILAVGYATQRPNGAAVPVVWRYDGSRWQMNAFSSGRSEQMVGVATAGDRFVVGGTISRGAGKDAAVWVSPDGQVWTPIRSPQLGGTGDQAIHRVVTGRAISRITGRPGVLAVGYTEPRKGHMDASLWASSDGLQWSRLQSPTFGGPGVQDMRSAVAYGSSIVGVGDASDPGSDMDAAVWFFNGHSWSRVSRDLLREPGTQQMTAVVKGPGGDLLAVGFSSSNTSTDAVVWRSPDGRHWTRLPPLEVFGGQGDQQMFGVVWTRAGFVTAGWDRAAGAIWTSRDGRRWQEESLPDPQGGSVQLRTTVVFHDRVFVLGRVFDRDYDAILRTGAIVSRP
jgi:serine/threonine-protein kinase